MKARKWWVVLGFSFFVVSLVLWARPQNVFPHRHDVLNKVRLGMTPEQIQTALNLQDGTINLWLKRPIGPAEYEAEIGEFDWRSWLKDQERFTFTFDAQRRLVGASVLTYRRQSGDGEEVLHLDSVKGGR